MSVLSNFDFKMSGDRVGSYAPAREGLLASNSKSTKRTRLERSSDSSLQI